MTIALSITAYLAIAFLVAIAVRLFGKDEKVAAISGTFWPFLGPIFCLYLFEAALSKINPYSQWNRHD